VGSQVGETAILSAAGRHLAATLPDVAFVEGSYGSLLLSEDVSADAIRFGHGGEARVLTGPGLGVRVVEARLRKHARRVVELGNGGHR
jgi:muconate cycloisomerase